MKWGTSMVFVLADTESFFFPFLSAIVLTVTLMESFSMTTLSPTAGISSVSTIVIGGIVIVSHFVTTVGSNNRAGFLSMAFLKCHSAEHPTNKGIAKTRENHFTIRNTFCGTKRPRKIWQPSQCSSILRHLAASYMLGC